MKKDTIVKMVRRYAKARTILINAGHQNPDEVYFTTNLINKNDWKYIYIEGTACFLYILQKSRFREKDFETATIF